MCNLLSNQHDQQASVNREKNELSGPVASYRAATEQLRLLLLSTTQLFGHLIIIHMMSPKNSRVRSLLSSVGQLRERAYEFVFACEGII